MFLIEDKTYESKAAYERLLTDLMDSVAALPDQGCIDLLRATVLHRLATSGNATDAMATAIMATVNGAIVQHYAAKVTHEAEAAEALEKALLYSARVVGPRGNSPKANAERRNQIAAWLRPVRRRLRYNAAKFFDALIEPEGVTTDVH